MQPTANNSSIPLKEIVKLAVKAGRWCFWVAIVGAFLPEVLVMINMYTSSGVSNYLLKGDVICTFALTLTASVIVDDIYFSKEMDKQMKACVYIAYFTACYLIAAAKCSVTKEAEYFNCSIILFIFALALAWAAKFYTFKVEFTRENAI